MSRIDELMVAIDMLQNSSAKEMERLKAELKAAEVEAKKAAIAEVRRIVTEARLTIEDLPFIPSQKPVKGSPLAGRRLKPKVVHPVDGRTWAGRGTKPQWVKDLEARQKARGDTQQGKLV